MGKLEITKTDEEINEKTEGDKNNLRDIELDEIAYTECVHSIDVRSCSGKVEFNMDKGCKSKKYIDRVASIAWDRVKRSLNLSHLLPW